MNRSLHALINTAWLPDSPMLVFILLYFQHFHPIHMFRLYSHMSTQEFEDLIQLIRSKLNKRVTMAFSWLEGCLHHLNQFPYTVIAPLVLLFESCYLQLCWWAHNIVLSSLRRHDESSDKTTTKLVVTPCGAHKQSGFFLWPLSSCIAYRAVIPTHHCVWSLN